MTEVGGFGFRTPGPLGQLAPPCIYYRGSRFRQREKGSFEGVMSVFFRILLSVSVPTGQPLTSGFFQLTGCVRQRCGLSPYMHIYLIKMT